MKHGVCIVECFDQSDPGSEGRVLKEIFNLMQVESGLVRVRSIEDLFETIAASDMKYVHVSTHGAETNSKTFGGWWTHKGRTKKYKLFKTSGTVRAAFGSYEAHYKNPHGFTLFRTNAA